MIPVKDINDVYPKFVPDQLLTSTDLNNLFNFLDQQQRMTRTNLIGIGIVCGLEVKKSSAGDTIFISRGCGVTSHGYLITLDDTVYDQFTEYDALQQDDYENVFVDLSGSTPQSRFDLLELHPSGVTPETPTDNQPKKLTELDLAEYAVLVFVELLETDNRNCDPSNCDDHGGNVTMTFKPLLIKISDIDELGESM